MLQLSLGYMVQAEREREVTEDLRSRQALLRPRDTRILAPASVNQSSAVRRGQARVRSTGA